MTLVRVQQIVGTVIIKEVLSFQTRQQNLPVRELHKLYAVLFYFRLDLLLYNEIREREGKKLILNAQTGYFNSDEATQPGELPHCNGNAC